MAFINRKVKERKKRPLPRGRLVSTPMAGCAGKRRRSLKEMLGELEPALKKTRLDEEEEDDEMVEPYFDEI